MRRNSTISLMALLPFACGLVLCGIIWQFFMQPRAAELKGDVEMQYVTTTYTYGGTDLFISTGYPTSFINRTTGAADATSNNGYERATDNTDMDVQTAGFPVGYVEGFDSGSQIAGKNYETLVVHDPNADIIIKLSQTEGFEFTQNSESLQAYYGDSNQVIAQLFERENWGEEKEVETAEFFSADDQPTGVTMVEERGNGWLGREALRYGTTIVDYRGETPWTFSTEFQTAPGIAIPAGSKTFVNGQFVYEVRTKVLESKIGWKVFDGFEVVGADGQVICQYTTKDELNYTSFEYVFECGGRKLGSIFVNVNSRYVYTPPVSGWLYGCPDDGCVETTYKFTYLLEGETWETKFANLKTIDMIMALLPDQVNKDSNYLHTLEEHTDAIIIAMTRPTDVDAQNWAIAFAQEEDSTMVRQAYETLIAPAISK